MWLSYFYVLYHFLLGLTVSAYGNPHQAFDVRKGISLQAIQGFRLQDGIITSFVIRLIGELWTFPVTGLPTLPTGADTQVGIIDFCKTLEVLGSTKCGIIELDVISEKEYSLCPNCGHQTDADTTMLQLVRRSCINMRRQCVQCVMNLGVVSGGGDQQRYGLAGS